MTSKQDRFAPPPPTLRVHVIPNPDVPGSDRAAELARRVVMDALAASGWVDHPPRRLRVVRGEEEVG
jgi:hypothetical protein